MVLSVLRAVPIATKSRPRLVPVPLVKSVFRFVVAAVFEIGGAGKWTTRTDDDGATAPG